MSTGPVAPATPGSNPNTRAVLDSLDASRRHQWFATAAIVLGQGLMVVALLYRPGASPTPSPAPLPVPAVVVDASFVTPGRVLAHAELAAHAKALRDAAADLDAGKALPDALKARQTDLDAGRKAAFAPAAAKLQPITDAHAQAAALRGLAKGVEQ